MSALRMAVDPARQTGSETMPESEVWKGRGVKLYRIRSAHLSLLFRGYRVITRERIVRTEIPTIQLSLLVGRRPPRSWWRRLVDDT